jgi:hypothetical protein
MQNVSPLFNRLISQANHWYETKVNINGVDYGEDQLFSVSTSAQMFGNDPEVGKAIAQEITLSMIQPSEDIPFMARVIPYVRVVGSVPIGTGSDFDGDTLLLNGYASFADDMVVFSDGSGAAIVGDTLMMTNQTGNLESEWIPQGVFYVDTRETSKNANGLPVLNLHGFDAMLKTEQDFPSVEGDWPMALTNVVANIARAIDVEVDPRTYVTMNRVYVGVIDLPAAYSMREVLGFIAAKCLGCFVMSDEGKLLLVSLVNLPPETNLLVNDVGDYITFGGERIVLSA